MRIFRCVVVPILFIALAVTTSRAQTAKEWETLNSKDNGAAADLVVAAFERARTKAVAHYRATNENARADLIYRLHPNVKELVGRVALAATVKPDALVETVMKGYIIDISAQLLSKPRGHDPAK